MDKKKIIKKAIIIQAMGMYNFLNIQIIPIIKKKENCKVILLVVDDKQAERYRNVLDKNDEIINIVKISKEKKSENSQISKDALLYEEKYGFLYLRDVIMQDRNYSTKYLNYSPFYVGDKNSFNDLNDIYQKINNIYKYFENFIHKYEVLFAVMRPDTVYDAPIANVLESNNILVTAPQSSRLKTYATWVYGAYRRDNYIKSKIKYINKLDQDISELNSKVARYPNNRFQKGLAASSYKLLIKDFIYETVDRSIFLYRGIIQFKLLDRRPFSDWIKRRYNTFKVSKWIENRNRELIDKISGEKFVLYMLGVQPEFNSHSLAREFWDERAIIQQIALSLPAGYKFLLKEHPAGIGNKSIDFYKDLEKIPNLYLVPTNYNGLYLINESSLVVTIAGTAGIESALLGKPSLILTNRVWYNFLPNIYVASNITDIGFKLKEALNMKISPEQVKKEAKILFQAVKDSSFDAENTPVLRGIKQNLEEKELNKAINILYDMKDFHFNRLKNINEK